MWTAYPIIASRHASCHAKTGSKNIETYRNHYIGYLFAGVQASVVSISLLFLLRVNVEKLRYEILLFAKYIPAERVQTWQPY